MRVLSTCAILLTLPLVSAAQAKLVRQGGALGASVGYSLSGDPLELLVLVPSFNPGPTPLALIDPLDGRALRVGTDLLGFALVGMLDGAGKASVSLPLPGSAALSGLPLFAQFVTLPGSPTLIDDVSNPTAFSLSFTGQSVFSVGKRAAAVDGHTQTLLADGTVLLAGGVELVTPTSGFVLGSFEVFDPQTQAFKKLQGTMKQARSAHTATRLTDGRVLLVGGIGGTGAVTNTAELFDPATGQTTVVAPMPTPRVLHTATALADGRALVVGGISLFDPNDPNGTLLSALATTLVYNPANNTWTPGPNLPAKLQGHQASLLGNGQVLISGGVEVGMLFGLPLPAITANCRRYNPTNNTFVATAPLPGVRSDHAQVALPNGGALIAGGQNINIATVSIAILGDTATYSSQTNTWTAAGPLTNARVAGQLVVAGSRLVITGGIAALDALTGVATPESSFETAPLSGSTWTAAGALKLDRLGALATPIESGARVLVSGVGDTGGGALDSSAEVYLP